MYNLWDEIKGKTLTTNSIGDIIISVKNMLSDKYSASSLNYTGKVTTNDIYKSIEELSQEELRLGGLRIDPKTNIYLVARIL